MTTVLTALLLPYTLLRCTSTIGALLNSGAGSASAGFSGPGRIILGLQFRVKSLRSNPIFRAKWPESCIFRKDHNFFSRSQNFLKIQHKSVNYL